ncbi:MAG: DUF4185 domain-containing protein [Bacteroidales bacterium]|nr:DUF4185 domain-containing protein [Bacteroidales bacterium]
MKKAVALIAILTSFCLHAASPEGKKVVLKNAHVVARVTGVPMEGENFPCPNNTAQDYDLHGTDLGMFWAIKDGKYGIFFGDSSGEGFKTFSNGGNGSNWRSNVLAYSSDTDLSDGLTIDGMAVDDEGKAREICLGGKGNQNPSDYFTSIPTSAVKAGKLDCVHYMNIHNWAGKHGRWPTHFSSLYVSEDDGASWRRAKEVTFGPESHFSQVAYGKKGGMVYMIGCWSGRGDDGYLARFREKDILRMDRYEYWNGSRWVKGDENAAAPVIKGPVGEASLLWQEELKRWILTYTCDPKLDENPIMDHQDILYLSTEDITSWNGPRQVLSVGNYRGMYGGYMHPLSAKGDKLYYMLSFWRPYNTFLCVADFSLE